MQHQLLTVNETAQLLRVSASTIRRWLRAGAIPSRKLGRRRLILAKDLEKIIENGLEITSKRGLSGANREY